WFHPCTSLSAGETISVIAPASSKAFFGSVSSTCSKPSATSMATFFPLSFFSMRLLLALLQTYRELLAGKWSAVTLLALVGGPQRGQVSRTPTCPALSGKFVLSNRGAARRGSQTSM